MTTLRIHTLETAPAESKPFLEGAQKAYGAIPNLLGVFAESPALLRSYLDLGEQFEKSSSFDATERQIVLLTTSFENECEYCMAAHSAIASLQKVPADVLQSLRAGTPITDSKLDALRTFTRKVVQKRGWVDVEDIQSFLAAGYTKRHVLEVVLGIGFKTLSNLTNHIAETPLDPQFQKFAWSQPKAAWSQPKAAWSQPKANA